MQGSYRSIAVDLDDVLFDFIGHFFDWHNEAYDTELQAEDMVHEFLWEVWGGTREQAAERVPRFFREINMAELDPMEGAVSALKRLRQDFRWIVISARDPAAADATRAWIDGFFPDVFEDIALGAGNPLPGNPKTTKADLCVEMGADLLLDDQLVNARQVAEAGIPVLLFGDRPWNQADSLPRNVQRVQDWPDVVSLLSGDA